jgi:hypothetical protein
MGLENTAQNANRKSPARVACLVAIACLMLLAANFSYAAFAEARVIRVTANEIAKLPARENYVVDLRQSEVTYDLDGTARAIDWNRVRVRRDSGEVGFLGYFRERFPKLAGKTPTRLVIGATGGIAQVFGLTDAPDGGTEYNCDKGIKMCDCNGTKDCNKMLKSGSCKNNVAECTADGGFYCVCDTN